MRKKRAAKIAAISLSAVVVIVAAVSVTKGRFVAFDYAFRGDSYLGNAVIADRVVVRDAALIKQLIGSSDFEDLRQQHPDFQRPTSDQVTAPHNSEELASYGAFFQEFEAIAARDQRRRTDDRAHDSVSLVHRLYNRNVGSSRKLDEGLIGKDRSLPENYVFYLVNAETACGTVGEASVALFRSAGYKARLILLAHHPNRIQADHVLAEYYSEQSGKWKMIDPIIDYHGRQSVLTMLADADMSKIPDSRHGVPHYRDGTTAVIDRRGAHRKLFYYTSNEDGRRIIESQLGQDQMKPTLGEAYTGSRS